MGLEVHSRLGRRNELGTFGTHIVTDVFLYDLSVLEGWALDPSMMVAELSTAIEKHGGDIMGHQYHIFDSCIRGSLTVMFMLRECHVALHTWPEKMYVALDVFCCARTDPIKIVQEIVSLLDAADTEMVIMKRGPDDE
jgi:S-adenosylmethionine/arginine decarboxylase-like enzyme